VAVSSAGHFAASNRYFHMKERSIEVTPPIQPGHSLTPNSAEQRSIEVKNSPRPGSFSLYASILGDELLWVGVIFVY